MQSFSGQLKTTLLWYTIKLLGNDIVLNIYVLFNVLKISGFFVTCCCLKALGLSIANQWACWGVLCTVWLHKKQVSKEGMSPNTGGGVVWPCHYIWRCVCEFTFVFWIVLALFCKDREEQGGSTMLLLILWFVSLQANHVLCLQIMWYMFHCKSHTISVEFCWFCDICSTYFTIQIAYYFCWFCGQIAYYFCWFCDETAYYFCGFCDMFHCKSHTISVDFVISVTAIRILFLLILWFICEYKAWIAMHCLVYIYI